MDKEELINGYFEDSLSQDQMKEVTILLKTDPEFAADFEFQKELQISLKKEERQDIKQLFSELSTKKDKPETKVISMRPWLVAASIIFLIGLTSWFFFFTISEPNTDQLYAANFTPYDNVIHPLERGDQLEDLKTQAFTAYENKEYTTALELFEELHTKQNDSYIAFYSAMVLMQFNKQEEAIPLLEAYIESDGELKDRALWYVSLSYLKLGKLDESRTQLQRLIIVDGFKKEAAAELLDEIAL